MEMSPSNNRLKPHLERLVAHKNVPIHGEAELPLLKKARVGFGVLGVCIQEKHNCVLGVCTQ